MFVRQRKRHFVVDDSSDDDDDDDDDDGMQSPYQQRRRLPLLMTDDDDDTDNDDVTIEDDIESVDWTAFAAAATADAAAAAAADHDDDDDDDDSGDDDDRGDDSDDDDDDDDDAADRLFVRRGHPMTDFDYRKSPYTPPILSQEQKECVEEDLKLLSSKGIYPYEYMDSLDKFKETAIPHIDAFHSRLTGKTITEDEHKHATHVFEHFGCNTLQGYHDLYLTQDVLLLNDVLIEFRRVCLETYNLDPWHYYTAPGLTWDAGLKFTGQTLQLLTEDDKFLFVEAGMRGGVSMITHRHAKANHPDLEDDGYFNKDEPRRQLLYLDANNLYGWAMSQYLPVSDFEWMSDEELASITEDWILSLAPDCDTGYFLEVDLIYPREVHSKHSDYPLAPEKIAIKGTQLSPYQRNVLRTQILKEADNDLTEEQVNAKIDAYQSVEKLVPNLCDKKKYILHYRNLQLYLKLGMKLGKIHQVLRFTQKQWLKPYIEHNTEMRKQGTSDFEKDFFKLMNNAFFGKTMENVRKRRVIDIVQTPQKLKKLVAQPTFKSITVFNEDLSAVERSKFKVYMDKPIYTGLPVLDLSKWLMYDFWYNKLRQLFPNAKLLFTDTDSLCVSIETDLDDKDVFEQLREKTIKLDDGTEVAATSLFDFSNYHKDHPCYSSINKKVPGKMKDELGGNIMLEFVGLRAKAYAFKKLVLYPDTDKNEKVGDIIETKKLKGIKKGVVKMCIYFQHYLDCLFKGIKHFATMVSLRSFKHSIKTLQQTKIAMTHFDDKRFLFQDGIESIPYGHYSITADD